MKKQFIVRITWPPEGRSRYGHAYLYLALAETEEEAAELVEAQWEGKQGGANPHTTDVEREDDGDLFQLTGLGLKSRSQHPAPKY